MLKKTTMEKVTVEKYDEEEGYDDGDDDETMMMMMTTTTMRMLACSCYTP